jgi:hypothetical protein
MTMSYGYSPVFGPKHPMVMCPRCKCCSLREPTDPESCVGPCTSCGHHEECMECRDKDRRIRDLEAFVADVVAGASMLG